MTLSEFRKRSNAFVANLDYHIGEVVDHNKKLIQLNTDQLEESKTSKGGALINTKTGSAYYSIPYGKKKGYTKPDLFVDGSFYKSIDILFNEPKEYVMLGYASVTKYLVEMYTQDLFGINNKAKAMAETTRGMSERYKKFVLNR